TSDDRVRVVEELRCRIEQAIEQVINIRVRVTLRQPGTLPRSEGKIQRVLDHRKM
ncbi:MAG: phenylacetate--CoA ligase, partial [Planctomycetia bacterium]|nr:phenylacetate--CoA ligase [Planctomycetia bacterium]